MRKKIIRLLLTGTGVLLPVAAFANSASDGDGGLSWTGILLSVFPFILIFGFVWLMIRRQQKSPQAQRQQQYLVRSQQHMERMEALLERLVVALEKKDKE